MKDIERKQADKPNLTFDVSVYLTKHSFLSYHLLWLPSSAAPTKRMRKATPDAINAHTTMQLHPCTPSHIQSRAPNHHIQTPQTHTSHLSSTLNLINLLPFNGNASSPSTIKHFHQLSLLPLPHTRKMLISGV